MEAPGGVEPPTNSLGNCCSIHLSYGAICTDAGSVSARIHRASTQLLSHAFSAVRSVPKRSQE